MDRYGPALNLKIRNALRPSYQSQRFFSPIEDSSFRASALVSDSAEQDRHMPFSADAFFCYGDFSKTEFAPVLWLHEGCASRSFLI